MSGAIADAESTSEPDVTYQDYEVVESKEVPLDEVKYIEEVYPRKEINEQAVGRYKDAIDSLPPIVLAEDYTIIDGYHRYRAHQQLNRETIEAEITNLSDSDQIYLAAIEANNDHGQQLVKRDKRAAANDLKLNHRLKNGEIALVLGISESTVRDYTTEANKKIREIRRDQTRLYYLDYLTCENQEAVAERLKEKDGIDVTRKTVSNDLGNDVVIDAFSKPHTLEQAAELSGDEKPDWLKWFNVWRFNGVNDDFGAEWAGRIPGQIIQNLLIHYTDRYDLVLDPMAGGGTTVDVCKAMGRRYAAYDLNPLEDKGIRKADTSDGFPVDDGVVDLVFMDPPYWNIKDDQYIEGSASAEDYDGWLDVMATMASESDRVLKSDGKAALLVMALEDETGDGQFRDLVVDCTERFRDTGFSVEQRISVPIPTEVKSGRDVKFAKENGRLLSVNRDLIIYA